MKKGIAAIIRFSINSLRHARLLLTGKETFSQALFEFRLDLNAGMRAVAQRNENPADHHKAAKLTEFGRKWYNSANYARAEKLFRDASLEDPHYTLPLAYLGNALYKQGKYEDAITAWNRAHALDPLSEGGLKAREKLNRIKDKQVALGKQMEARVNPIKLDSW